MIQTQHGGDDDGVERGALSRGIELAGPDEAKGVFSAPIVVPDAVGILVNER